MLNKGDALGKVTSLQRQAFFWRLTNFLHAYIFTALFGNFAYSFFVMMRKMIGRMPAVLSRRMRTNQPVRSSLAARHKANPFRTISTIARRKTRPTTGPKAYEWNTYCPGPL